MKMPHSKCWSGIFIYEEFDYNVLIRVFIYLCFMVLLTDSIKLKPSYIGPPSIISSIMQLVLNAPSYITKLSVRRICRICQWPFWSHKAHRFQM